MGIVLKNLHALTNLTCIIILTDRLFSQYMKWRNKGTDAIKIAQVPQLVGGRAELPDPSTPRWQPLCSTAFW